MKRDEGEGRDDTLQQPTKAARPDARDVAPAHGPEVDSKEDVATVAALPVGMIPSHPPPLHPSATPPPLPASGAGADQSGPHSASIAGGSGSTSIAATSISAPLETLRVQEIHRTRAFIKLALGLAVTVGALTLLGGGDPLGKRVILVGLGAIALAAMWLAWMIRSDEGYTLGRTLTAAYVCIFGAFCAIYFFGVFSPAPMVLPFGLFFFSAAQSFRATVAVYVTCAVAQGALMVATMTGVLVDRGLISGSSLRPFDQVVVFITVELVMLATFVLSRATRRATLDAMERHDRAVRGIAQREALLREVKQDLDRALKSGGLGRFTDTTLGVFRLGKVIGRGGMGEVYEATNVTTHEAAAVKLLHAHVLADPDLLRRFMREAKIVGSLNAPNVVRVLDIGGLDAPVPFIAMERLRGEDLADHLRRHRALTMSKTLTLVRQVGKGLLAARSAGIVHRDLKPRNLFLAEDGLTRRTWKILDFGVSKLGDGEGTQTKGMLVGTPAYMAPEQANGGQVSHLTDLYALGVIAYRALTGRPAFTGDRTAETLYQVVYQMPPRPSDVARLPESVDLVLAIAMAKDASSRFDSGAEMADALEAAQQGRLSPELLSRGERLLEKMPWGKGT